ncbi:MAG: hypothetical protein ACP6IP_07970 [Candidatus Njordarchaeia archaeon]
MEYYQEIKGLTELMEIFRVPRTILEDYILDDTRKEALKLCFTALNNGKNIIITGDLGVGKTSFLIYLLNELILKGFRIGLLLFGTPTLGREHEEKGIILVADDLDEYGINILKAIEKMGVRGIVSTIDKRALLNLVSEIGDNWLRNFEIVELEPFESKNIKKLIENFSSRYNIRIDEGAIRAVEEKSNGNPLYIQQLFNRTKKKKINLLEQDIVEEFPSSITALTEKEIYDYINEYYGDEKKLTILMMLILSDIGEGYLHKDILLALYKILMQEVMGKDIDIMDMLLNIRLEKKFPFLVSILKYYLGLPHDSWREALKESKKTDITIVNLKYPKETRFNLLMQAISLARDKIIDVIREEKDRLEALEKNIKRLIMEKEETEIKSKAIIKDKQEIQQLAIEKVEVEDRFFEEVVKLPPSLFLESILDIINRHVKTTLYRDFLGPTLGDLLKKGYFMIFPYEINDEGVKAILDLKINGELNEDKISFLKEKAKGLSIYREELLVLKTGYNIDLDVHITDLAKGIDLDRVTMKLLILGLKSSQILNKMLEFLPLRIYIDLMWDAVYKEGFNPVHILKKLKKEDQIKTLSTLAISAKTLEQKNKIREYVEKNIKLVYTNLFVKSLLIENEKEAKNLLEQLSWLPQNEMLDYMQNIIHSIYYRAGEHKRNIIEMLLGMTSKQESDLSLKLAILEAISKTKPIRLAEAEVIRLINNSPNLAKRYAKKIARISGYLRSPRLLEELLKLVSQESNKWKIIELALLCGLAY